MQPNSTARFLVIQTAFIGDVILATAVLEKLHIHFPQAKIDILVRQGNDALLHDHPFVHQIIVWNKNKQKYISLLKILKTIRQQRYDYVINLQRFLATGFLTIFSGAKNTIGFNKNPLSFLFNKRVKHLINKGEHEVHRNLKLIAHLTDNTFVLPKLYPSKANYDQVARYKKQPYICIAPTSVWFTKQLPKEKWIELIDQQKHDRIIYLLGSQNDVEFCNTLQQNVTHKHVINLAGKLNLLASAALMQDALMNYVNDSAPMHLCSAMNANTTAFFCSTIPDFGFGPLAQNSQIVEIKDKLSCRPCGLHGHKKCPQGHFKCGYNINIKKLITE